MFLGSAFFCSLLFVHWKKWWEQWCKFETLKSSLAVSHSSAWNILLLLYILLSGSFSLFRVRDVLMKTTGMKVWMTEDFTGKTLRFSSTCLSLLYHKLLVFFLFSSLYFSPGAIMRTSLMSVAVTKEVTGDFPHVNFRWPMSVMSSDACFPFFRLCRPWETRSRN